MIVYPGRYTDKNGTEETTVSNDGDTLRMILRGMKFSGNDFNDFEPPIGATDAQLTAFTLTSHRTLAAYRLDVTMPVRVHTPLGEQPGGLSIGIVVGTEVAAPTYGFDEYGYGLTLSYADQQFRSQERYGGFSDAAHDLHRQLPCGVYLKACISCRWADYSPYGGHFSFDDLYCHRRCKAEFSAAATKFEFGHLYHIGVNDPVQATFLCDEFEYRVNDRGFW